RPGVDPEEPVRPGRSPPAEQADGFGGLQGAGKRDDGSEDARFLAARHLVGRRRLLEDAAVARALPRDDGHELRDEAEHPGEDESRRRSEPADADDENAPGGEVEIRFMVHEHGNKKPLPRGKGLTSVRTLSSAGSCERCVGISTSVPKDRLLWLRRAGPSATLDKAMFFLLSRMGRNPKGPTVSMCAAALGARPKTSWVANRTRPCSVRITPACP